jgi:peptide/nickel transport system substrate-binding protein
VGELADYETHLIDSNSIMHLDLSVSTPRGEVLFSDPRVRRAIFMAIDRQAIADQLMQGTVQIADSAINRNSPYFNPDLEAYTFDPARARLLLDEAGWLPAGDGVRARGGERLAFALLNRAGNADRNAIALVVQAQLREIGVEVSFETLESAAWTQRWRTGQWEAIVSAWFLPADPSLTNLYACDGANNMTGACDPELDRTLRDSDRQLDLTARRPLLLRAQQRLLDSARFLPLYYNVVPEVVHRRVRGYRGSGTNFGSFWNLHEWSLASPEQGP